MILAGTADHPGTAGVVPAAQLALPREDRGVAPLVVLAVIVSDTAWVLGSGGGPGAGGGHMAGGRLCEAHYPLSSGPVTDRAQISLISAGRRQVSDGQWWAGQTLQDTCSRTGARHRDHTDYQHREHRRTDRDPGGYTPRTWCNLTNGGKLLSPAGQTI